MKNRVQKGSITVFLSLMLVLLISLMTASLESAHLAAVRGQISMGSESAMYTLFSYYEKNLYDEYKLLFLNNRQDCIGILKTEMELYGKLDTSILQGQNHLLFGTESVDIDNEVYLMDNNGSAFQEEVNQIIASDIIAMVKNSIWGNVKKLSQSSLVTEYMNEIMTQGAELENLEEQMGKVSQKTTSANNKIENLKKQSELSIKKLSQYKKVLEAYQKGDSSGYEVAIEKNRFEKELKILSEEKKTLEKELQNILTDLEKYEKSADKVTSNLKDVRESIQKDELEKSYKNTLEEELKSVLEMTSESGTWYQQVRKAKNVVVKNLNELQIMGIPTSDEISQKSILNGSIEKKLQQIKQNATKLNSVKFSITESKADGEKNSIGKSLINSVQMLITDGVFSIIVDKKANISKRTVKIQDKPSQGKKDKGSTNEKTIFQRILDDTKDTVALNIYLSEYMDCYTDGKNYDLEYILGKSNSDKENLKTVVNQLVFLRQAMNLMYLLSDSTKKQEAELCATAMFAITVNPVVIEGMTMVILTAWAYAEAVSDVKALLNGEKIDFIKNSNSWNLSLKNAANYKNWTNKSKSGKKTGMNYKEYLRILLFFHSRNTNMFRGLDMIQWNICQKDSDFRISQCIYSMEIKFSLRVNSIFLSVNNLSAGGKSGYVYEHKEQKKYG
jgi:hypothetical protein